jgi:two-component system, chemotaxis family, protein-glutamate methylesterase/glutaminase
MAQDAVRHKMIVIGGSAGSLDIILKIIPLLPSQSGASFLIVIHRKNDSDSILADLLTTRTKMNVSEVEDKQPIRPDTIYIAPADYHLLLEDERTFSLDSSEKIHFSRPSIDVTFESVAEVFGSSAIGILLSGANADGAEGLRKIKAAGGYTIVQDPASADVGYMPQQAINLGAVDAIVNSNDLPQFIKGLFEN